MQISFLTYNIRGGRGTEGRVSLAGTAAAMGASGACVAGLQEVEALHSRSRFMFQAKKLGKMLGMHYEYGPNVRRCFMAMLGNAVLSRLPLLKTSNYRLPSAGEKRGLLRAEISAGSRRIVFYTTHLGLHRAERLQQAKAITRMIASETQPVVLTGDFNAPPDSPEIKVVRATLASADPTGKMPTYTSTSPEHVIDYIFFSAHWKLVQSKTIYSPASDHLPLLAVLWLD